MSETKNQVCAIIGASHAGVNLAFNLRKEGWEGEIIIYDKESTGMQFINKLKAN